MNTAEDCPLLATWHDIMQPATYKPVVQSCCR